jgi:hypothetical protein
MQYTFRVRQKASAAGLDHMSVSQFHFSYGYCLFRKYRDAKSKRGWSQESFVIVSELNLVSLFYKLNEIISAETDTKTTFEKIYQLSV